MVLYYNEMQRLEFIYCENGWNLTKLGSKLIDLLPCSENKNSYSFFADVFFFYRCISRVVKMLKVVFLWRQVLKGTEGWWIFNDFHLWSEELKIIPHCDSSRHTFRFNRASMTSVRPYLILWPLTSHTYCVGLP